MEYIMSLFKKKQPKPKVKVEPYAYPNRYVLRLLKDDFYIIQDIFEANTKEDIDKYIAFYSQPTVYV